MGISDFFKKVRTLLEGEQQEDEVYTEDVKPERIRVESDEYKADSAARLAERMADQYVDPDAPDEDDEPAYRANDRFYHMPDSYSDNDFASDDYEDDFDEDIEDEEEIYTPVRPEPEYRSEPVAVTADGLEAQEPLPTRTEVTLRQIEKLSKKLDDETLRAYQIRLVRLKQETGAVSALTALRILHEYVDDDEAEENVDAAQLPDLSAR